MCHFITLIAPTGDQAALEAVMAGHGRRARPVANASVARLLLPGERQYLTFRAHCDCGTALGWPREERDAAAADEFAREEARLRRRGWSEAKVARAIEDRKRTLAKPPRRPLDSHRLWATILTDLFERLELPRLGLLVHSYRGDLNEEEIEAVRREVPREMPLLSAIEEMGEDVVTMFARR